MIPQTCNGSQPQKARLRTNGNAKVAKLKAPLTVLILAIAQPDRAAIKPDRGAAVLLIRPVGKRNTWLTHFVAGIDQYLYNLTNTIVFQSDRLEKNL